MTNDHTPARGDHVTAVLYGFDPDEGGDGIVAGTYMPRDDFPDAVPPDDAAWVETGDGRGALMVQATSVVPTRQTPTLGDLAAAIRKASLDFAEGLKRTQHGTALLPGIPKPAPDPRHTSITVRTARLMGSDPERHTYRDGRGLSWETHGEDFSQDRILEIYDVDNNVIATYPAATYLHVCYDAYLDTTEAMS